MVRSSLCSSEEGSTEIILDEDFLASSSEFNEDQICEMSARNSKDIREDPLKPFEEFVLEENEAEDLEDDSIDKDVTIDEYIEDDFRNGFDFFGFSLILKLSLTSSSFSFRKRKLKPYKHESIRHLYLGFG